MTSIMNIRAANRVLAALAATALISFSQSAAAQGTNLAGAWKIDPAKSSFSARSASLSIAREGSATDKASGSILVVSNEGNVYLATGEAMSSPMKVAEYSRIESSKMVLIGTSARRDDYCGFRCQSGLMERSITLRFNSVDGAEQLMGEMLAYKASKP